MEGYPHVSIVHEISGRIRLRTNLAQDELLNFSQKIAHLPGVKSVIPNVKTSSLLVNYKGERQRLLETIKPHFTPEKSAARGGLNLYHLGFAAFCGAGLSQLMKGNALPPALTLFEKAFKMLKSSNQASS